MNVARTVLPAAALLLLGATLAGTAQQPPGGRANPPPRPQGAPLGVPLLVEGQPARAEPRTVLFSARYVEIAADAPAELVNRLRHAAGTSRSLAPENDAPAFDMISAALDAPGVTAWSWSASAPLLEESHARVQESIGGRVVQAPGQGPTMSAREYGHSLLIRLSRTTLGHRAEIEFNSSQPFTPPEENRTRSLQISTTCNLPANHTGVISLSTPSTDPSTGGNTRSFFIFTLR